MATICYWRWSSRDSTRTTDRVTVPTAASWQTDHRVSCDRAEMEHRLVGVCVRSRRRSLSKLKIIHSTQTGPDSEWTYPSWRGKKF
uniref:Uncharacterized protein n=1 Tax=Anopheles arabiensis TaxID=7173 RepID=A0A182IFF1_ANOAR